MSMGVLKHLFEQLEQRQNGGAVTPVTPPENIGVTPKPAPALACTRVTPVTPESDDFGNHVAAPAANDSGDGVAAWIERRQVQGLDGASPTTVAKFRAASEALDAQIAAAGGAVADPDRHCWPNDPGPGAAMNGAEIDRMASRVELFSRRGLQPERAEALADKLVRRDRDGDDRRTCIECGHFIKGRRCAAWQQAGIGGPQVGDLLLKLQRCPAYRDGGQP